MILFVDDDQHILNGYRRTLSKLYDIDTAESGAEAIKLIGDNDTYAVIVSDIDMPEMNGIEFLQKAERLSPDSVKLALSGTGDRESIIGAINSGRIFRYLSKPIRRKELREALDEAVGVFLKNQQSKYASSLSSERFVEYGRHIGHAVRNRELFIEYQPQVDLATGAVTGVEALTRWRHPEFGCVPPGDFIPIAKISGAIVPLTHWLIETVGEDIARWNLLGLRFNVAVNISMAHFTQLNLLETVKRTFDRPGHHPARLELEMTETVLDENPNALRESFDRLAGLGVGIALDDFGSGFMRYDYLMNLPITKLKIDSSHIQRVTEEDNRAAIVKSLVTAGQSMGIIVVAEGLETAGQFASLADMGCHLGQGYYFSRPLPFDDLTYWVQQSAHGVRLWRA